MREQTTAELHAGYPNLEANAASSVAIASMVSELLQINNLILAPLNKALLYKSSDCH